MQNLSNYLPMAISTFKAIFVFNPNKKTINLSKSKINNKYRPFTFIYKSQDTKIILAIKYHKDVIGRRDEEIIIKTPVYIDNIRFGGKEYSLTISKREEKSIFPKLRIEIEKS